MDRKENILNTALELFSHKNFDKVSTALIAKKSDVSEGLIFKHFGNKKTLFSSVMEKAEAKIQDRVQNILEEEDALKVIRKTIEMPFEIKEREYHFWRLIYMSRWEVDFKNSDRMMPLINKLTWAFQTLGFQEAEKEAGMLNLIVNSITANIIREGKINQLQFKYFLIHKYTL